MYTDASATPLAQAVDAARAVHVGLSGTHSLLEGHDAFAARFLLAEHARHSLDVQYYIWEYDLSGRLMLDALRRAAERGVHVRLLLDDNNTGAKLDEALAALDAHPNIAVRLFNAMPIRQPRWLSYLLSPRRANRRMHNKSFTADRAATVVGGRNIGDEYFDAGTQTAFADLDVLAVGPVVDEVAADFERYWHSDCVVPLAQVLPAARRDVVAAWGRALAAAIAAPATERYRRAVAECDFVQALIDGTLSMDWSTVRLVSDDPAKGRGRAQPRQMLPERLQAILGEPRHELVLVSPYFVPTRAGVAALGAMAARGVRIDVLTNAFEATDVAVVHAGYAKRRKPLLRHGIRLFEMKREAPDAGHGGKRGPFGSSASSLHAKTFSVDGRRVFIGSFNFDPRSARLNTEMGVVIDSPALAQRMADVMRARMPSRTYALGLEHGRLHWRDGYRTLRSEPGMNLGQRVMVTVLSWLPIESLL